jgi:hypothetical protein
VTSVDDLHSKTSALRDLITQGGTAIRFDELRSYVSPVLTASGCTTWEDAMGAVACDVSVRKTTIELQQRKSIADG